MFRQDQPTNPSAPTSSPSSPSVFRAFFYPAAATGLASASTSTEGTSHLPSNTSDDKNLDFTERAISAAGAAFLSAIIVNPLDVVKTRLQAQGAGGSYKHYNGTFDVFYKIVRQEGISRLWRGTNAGLALAIPTVGIYLPCYDVFRDVLESYSSSKYPQLTPYAPLLAGSAARSLACIICSPIELARVRMQAQRQIRGGGKPPGMLKTLFGVLSSASIASGEPLKGVRALWTGVGAQLARDVPFSAICWATLEPLRREILQRLGSEPSVAVVLGSNFTAGVIAGGIAAAATCPLDVAKTRRQIQDPSKVVTNSTTRKVLAQLWREEGFRGLFTGVVPRVARAGPSVAIVVSFYEVVKYVLHHGHTHTLSQGRQTDMQGG